MEALRLEIKDVTVAYNRVPAIHHLNLTIEGGYCIALMGPNGAGKTTLLKTIAGLLPVETGKITFQGRGLRQAAHETAYLPQREQVDWDFPITVRGLVEMGCYMRLGWWRRFGPPEREAVERAVAAMHLEELAERQISALSGGQQQRAFLARSLAQSARIFLLDEPFTGLDRPSQQNLARTMRELAAAGHIVMASHHDLKNVADFFDRVIFLNGELIAYGDAATAFTEENIARTFDTRVFSGEEGMNWLLEPFHHEFMQRALLGCALIGFTNGYLSAFIVLRRLALMADALSHSLLPGLAIGLLLFKLTPLSLFAGGLVAALLVALGSEMISRSSRIKEETALAVLYTLAFSAGIVLLSFAHVQVELEHYLFGNILGLSDSDLWITYWISLVILPLLVAFQRPLLVMLFEPAVAKSQGVNVLGLNYLLIVFLVLAMISSLQAVGVILALGLLVAPAATVYLFSDSCPTLFWGGGAVGMAGACGGLLISYWLNIPAGACIVLLLGLVFFASYICSPRYGVFRKAFMKRHLHEESLARWRGAVGPGGEAAGKSDESGRGKACPGGGWHS